MNSKRTGELIQFIDLMRRICMAPTNRFGKLEFHTPEMTAAREELRQLAIIYKVAPASTVIHQAGLVAAAIIHKSL